MHERKTCEFCFSPSTTSAQGLDSSCEAGPQAPLHTGPSRRPLQVIAVGCVRMGWEGFIRCHVKSYTGYYRTEGGSGTLPAEDVGVQSPAGHLVVKRNSLKPVIQVISVYFLGPKYHSLGTKGKELVS